ncbi:guanine nucleotide binding protein (G-protein), alpha subunit, partial [Kipferlia bialata]
PNNEASLRQCFPRYEVPDGERKCNVNRAITYIKNEFVSLNHNRRKMVYPYVTTATDSKNVQRVFATVKDIVLKINLRQTGLM